MNKNEHYNITKVPQKYHYTGKGIIEKNSRKKYGNKEPIEERNNSFIRSIIHEHTVSLMCLGIILRVLRLEVSVYIVFITNQFSNIFAQGGEGWGSKIRLQR
jgi:hypothetical protein